MHKAEPYALKEPTNLHGLFPSTAGSPAVRPLQRFRPARRQPRRVTVVRRGAQGQGEIRHPDLDVGGPAHLDTFDPNPTRATTTRGPEDPIETNVHGIRIGELLPLLAKQATSTP